MFANCFHAGFLLGLAYSSTLKMEVICSSEMSIDCQQSTRPYIPEDITLFVEEVRHITIFLNLKFLPILVVNCLDFGQICIVVSYSV
jgi:hypothetical protein